MSDIHGGETARERAETRARKLLQAATEVIGEEGFQAATVRAVCGRAGLTQRYYYEAFDGAEDVLIAVYESQLDVIEDALLKARGIR